MPTSTAWSSTASESADLLAAASERRLARLGFDLHDGPIQSLAALIGETRLLHSQVGEIVGEVPSQAVLRGRVEDLQARMVALEFELRCMSHSLEAPAVPCRSFERVIEHEAVGFQRQTGISPVIDMSGDFCDISDSQRVALLRMVQEGLRNIGEHSGASAVAIKIHATAYGVEASIEDNGRGFDVDAALAKAIRDGRLGLIGMIERLRLLGGFCELTSSPGSSVISVSIPRWEAAETA